MLTQTSPQMEKTVGVLKELSADERTRLLYEAREKARWNEQARLHYAVEQDLDYCLSMVNLPLSCDLDYKPTPLFYKSNLSKMLELDIHPHMIRHTFASQVVANEMSPVEVAK